MLQTMYYSCNINATNDIHQQYATVITTSPYTAWPIAGLDPQ
jgi:hypothetical protein